MPKKSKPVEPVPEEAKDEVATCPVCGKPVGLNVATCPNCGAEFEEEAVEEEQPEVASAGPAKAGPGASPKEDVDAVSEEEMAECPVCGKSVGLSQSTCPNCGAEFEEEEVEEVIEVEEKEAPVDELEVEEANDDVAAEENESSTMQRLTSVLDLRVLGIALIILGIIGAQIAAMVKWYWTWVPPIKTNLGIFIAIAVVVIVVGLLVYMLADRAISSGKEVPTMMPNLMFSLFLFGIMALILILFWSPINSALQHSSLGVAGVFLGVLIVGVLAMIMGQRMIDKAASPA